MAKQTFADVEHVVIDGASQDDTLDIVQQYPHVAKIQSERDQGIYDAMNKGIACVTGDVVGILNSDDFYTDEHVLSRVVECFQQHQVDAVYGDLNYVHPTDTDKVIRFWRSGPYDRRRFLQGWMPPHPTFFVRRELYEKFGGFDLDLKIAADYEIMLRFLYKNHATAHYVPHVLVQMRNGGASNVSLVSRLQAHREDLLAWRKNDLKPRYYTTLLKPIQKLGQYFPAK